MQGKFDWKSDPDTLSVEIYKGRVRLLREASRSIHPVFRRPLGYYTRLRKSIVDRYQIIGEVKRIKTSGRSVPREG